MVSSMKTKNETLAFLRLLWTLTNGKIATGAVLTFLGGITEGISLVLLIPIVAAAVPEQAGQVSQIPLIGQLLVDLAPSLASLLCVFVGVVGLQALLQRYKSLYNNKIMLQVGDKIRLLLFERVAMANWDAISNKRVSDINHVLISDTGRMLLSAAMMLTLFQAVTMLAVYMLIAAAVSWQMALFATGVGFTLFTLLYPIRRRSTAHGSELTQMLQGQNNVVLEFISSIRLAKLFTAEDRHVRQYLAYLSNIRERSHSYVRLTSSGALFFQVSAAVVAASFVWWSIEVHNLDVARIGVLLVIFIRLAPKFNIIQDATQQYLANIPAFANYRAMVEYFNNSRETDREIREPTPRLSQNLRFEQVSMQFVEATAPALKSVSIEIAAKRITALIGPSGSGKSTIADLALGLTSPHFGSITADGIEIQGRNRRAWRSSVACVPQDAFLLNDTIRQNLRLGGPQASDTELWASLEQAHIADLVRSLPQGLDTVVGERGSRFSGGERQRIALARALLRKPQLLVLDEATSALDWESQNIIAAAIEALRGELTILTIAHRPSLIAFADDVIAMESGCCVEFGRFADLSRDPSSRLSQMLRGEASG